MLSLQKGLAHLHCATHGHSLVTAHFNSSNCLLCNNEAFYRCMNSQYKLALYKDHFQEFDSKTKRKKTVYLEINKPFFGININEPSQQ